MDGGFQNSNMYLKTIRHNKIDSKYLEEVIKLKSVAWPFSTEMQELWIQKNLEPEDIHCFLMNGKNPIAYLNLINISITIDGLTYLGWGVGNVCAIEQGKGLGSSIIQKINELLVKEKKIGLLFCKSALINFYHKNGWELIPSPKITLDFNHDLVESLIYNYNYPFNKIEYLGRSF